MGQAARSIPGDDDARSARGRTAGGGLLATSLRVLAGLTLLVYPLLVWRGLASESPRSIALVLLFVLAPGTYLRLRGSERARMRGLAVIPLVAATALGLATLLDSTGFILVVPVAINATLLVAFGTTLRSGAVPMIERFARLQEEHLSSDQLRWCRAWTLVWCAFFTLNGGIAALLAWQAPLRWWAFYNGLLAYLLIGSLVALEWILRRRRFPPAAPRPASRAKGEAP